MFRQFLIVCSAGLLVHVTACLAVCLHHLPYLPCPTCPALLYLPCPALPCPALPCPALP